MRIRALIFDFDGLIVDTETADYEAWRHTFAHYGFELDPALWATGIGSYHTYDPYEHLSELVGRPLSREEIRPVRRPKFEELLEGRGPLPGVIDYVEGALERGLRLAIASSSPIGWVAPKLESLGLGDRFPVLATGDEVERTKPDPAVFSLAAAKLGVTGTECVALEDSPNGILAAKAAGMFAVAVPNAMTNSLSFPGADLRLQSLASMPLGELLSVAESSVR